MEKEDLLKNKNIDFKDKLKLERMAHKKIMLKIATSSLAKMEKILVNDPDTELKFPISAYCSIKKKDKLNPIKHPNLLIQVKKWENAIEKASSNDEYFKFFIEMYNELKEKDRKLNFKILTAKKVNEIIKEQNLSIRLVSEFTNIKYANLYNFLKKEVYTDISWKKSHALLCMVMNIKPGITKEEAYFLHKEKLKKVKNYWDEELLGKEEK